MNNTEICNAIIKSVSLGDDEHGGMTFWLHLDYGHSGQGFGGFSFGSDSAPPLVYMHITIREILRVIGVRKWEDLAGTVCRAEIEGGLVRGIGNVIKDEWFRPKEVYEQYADPEYRVQMIGTLARHAQALLDLFVKAKGEDFASECYQVRLLREDLTEIGGTP